MKQVLISWLVIVLVGLAGACGPSKSEWSPRFENLEDFTAWMKASEEKEVTFRDSMLFQFVGAIDGAAVLIDGRKAECYIFSDRTNWEGYKNYMKNTLRSIGEQFDPKKLTVYYNAKCYFTE